ncbi:Uncharacterised nucleotidyltransferase [Rathayibacter oskolensis]|uniref:Uncharacterized nucleotidyltransferase n=1 Tax=Rathayibacter oskolensis TaxID=1891671 RepID=A0A1X7ND28_9MICO|nr:nucleotidyltransferase family protein [Rathayibacter oskolensis]SMH34700.1 Uncharacterised nucleotidyltransferase [Rathayibacter oskolensis]
MTPTLLLAEAVPLASALAAEIARTEGIRLLCIKGPSAAILGLREPRVSSDVDVLVDPAQWDAFVDQLVRRGWKARVESDAPRFFPRHSQTYSHPAWPCDIDVHHQYPGFFAAPGEAFAVLWPRRTSVALAGVDVEVPDRIASGLILAVHALRDPEAPRSISELALLETRLVNDSGDMQDVLQLAERLRARSTLRPFLRRLPGIGPLPEDLTSHELEAWLLLTANERTTAFHWWVALTKGPWARRPRILVKAFRPIVTALVRGEVSWTETVRSLRLHARGIRRSRAAFRRSRARRWTEDEQGRRRSR